MYEQAWSPCDRTVVIVWPNCGHAMTELRSSHDHSVVNKILVQYGGNILYVVTATEIYAGDYIIDNVGTGKHGMCKETKLGDIVVLRLSRC